MESQLAIHTATTSTKLQEFWVQTKNDIQDGLAECLGYKLAALSHGYDLVPGWRVVWRKGLCMTAIQEGGKDKECGFE